MSTSTVHTKYPWKFTDIAIDGTSTSPGTSDTIGDASTPAGAIDLS